MAKVEARTRRIQQILDECMKAQAEGGQVDCDELIAVHPDLMPELGQELALLAAIDEGIKGLSMDHDSRATAATRTFVGVGVDSDSALQPGAKIGPYELISVLGEGGMGKVFVARQEKPHRQVALKVIRPHYATPKLLRRFEHEAEVLGRLLHPGIAQIYEAGTFQTGERQQPFFAMELVQGLTLSRYAGKNHLTTHQRLELFADICDAVQHAHLKGVIHRDLKPGNILVTQDGQPKVLDFGVARVTDSDLQATTLQTDVAQLVGTVPYMSPEQVSASSEDLDTRSDVYALGVVLYELLVGKLPYDLSNRMIHEAVRIIKEDEPTRLGSVNTALRGDVETIVAKALEKERDRRYQTAIDLGTDIRRYLNHEPISARADSQWYRLRKKLTRHRTSVMSSAVILAVLAVASTVTLQYRSQVAVERTRSTQAATESRRRHAEQSFQTAHMEFLRGNYHDALRMVEDCLQAAPGNRPAKLLRARVEARTETRKVAITDIEGLLDASEAWSQVERGELHILLASLYAQQQNDRLFQQHIAAAQRLLPRPADLHYAKALTAVLTSDMQAELNEALAADPDHFDSLMARAYIHLQHVNLEEALVDAERAALLRPLDDQTRTVVAMILYAQGHIGRAYDRFRGYDPEKLNSALLFEVMAWTDVRKSNVKSPKERASLEREVQRLTEALERCPSDGLSYAVRGANLLNLGRRVQADRDFDRAVSLGELRGYAWRVIARRSNLEQLTSRQNLEDIEQLIAHGFAAFLLEKGYLFMFRGEPQKALAAYDAALDLDSRNFIAHLAKPWVRYYCWRTGSAPSSLDDIRADFDAAIDCGSWGSAVFADAVADMVRSQLGWFPEDYPFAEAARYVQAPSAETWRVLGKALLMHVAAPVDDRGALAFFNQRLAFDAEDPDGLAGLARLHLDSADPTIQDVSKAVELAERAVRLGPGFGLYRRLLGRAYLAVGDPQSAGRQLDRALEANGENEWDLLLRAQARHRAGLVDPARADLALAEELLAEIDDDPDADLDELHRQVVLETTLEPDQRTQSPGAAGSRR